MKGRWDGEEDVRGDSSSPCGARPRMSEREGRGRRKERAKGGEGGGAKGERGRWSARGEGALGRGVSLNLFFCVREICVEKEQGVSFSSSVRTRARRGGGGAAGGYQRAGAE